jgi:hypothetical protein
MNTENDKSKNPDLNLINKLVDRTNKIMKVFAFIFICFIWLFTWVKITFIISWLCLPILFMWTDESLYIKIFFTIPCAIGILSTFIYGIAECIRIYKTYNLKKGTEIGGIIDRFINEMLPDIFNKKNDNQEKK